jgi:phospholipid/cholesterol/gamma-HCH transport system substrate-binding protein
MKNVSTELKVGLFAIVVIIILSYMTFKVGRMTFMWEKGYRLYAEFDDISGMDEKSRIKVAGVEAGIVDKIDLENGKAKLTLLINPDIKVYRNASVSLKMSGLLGDRYLALSTGTPDQPLLESGDYITNVIHAADIDVLANKLTLAATYISDLTQSLNGVFGDKEREALSESIHNLRTITQNLKEISADNKEPIHKVIVQLETFTEALAAKGPGFMDDMGRTAKVLGDKGPQLIDDLAKLTSDLKEVIGENRYAFKESMENIRAVSKSASNITQRIESGEGTLGKLVKDDKIYNSLSKISEEAGKSVDFVGRLRTLMDFHTEYNTHEAQWKGYFDLTLQPRRDNYYILGVVTDPKGTVETTDKVINGFKITKEETTSRIEFSAQFARRYEDLAFRIGMIENTFGFGADYFFNDDKGRARVDMWDFSAKEAEAKRAHAKIGVDYRIFKYVFVSSGIDNLLNSGRRGIYIGGGLKFEDEDFKYLLGKMPSPSLR